MAGENATIFRIPTANDPVLAQVVHRLVKAYRPQRVYLFGSVAKEDASPHSDYDVLVDVLDEAQPARRRSHVAL